MAMCLETLDGWCLDSQKHFNQMYCETAKLPKAQCFKVEWDQTTSLKVKPCLFNITSQFMMDSQAAALAKLEDNEPQTIKRKRKIASKVDNPVDRVVEELFNQVMKKATQNGIFITEPSIINRSELRDNNRQAREAATQLGGGELLIEMCHTAHQSKLDVSRMEITADNITELFQNSLFHNFVSIDVKRPCLLPLFGSQYILPANCRFLMSDISKIKALCGDGEKYDFIVMDPPWENKSVKRKKTYNTLTNYDMFKLPLKKLCSDTVVVACWVTNKPATQAFLLDKLLPHWGLVHAGTWYWVKVTTFGVPVKPFHSDGKKPYECLFIACREENLNKLSPDLRSPRVIVSVPSALHSAKPCLSEIFSQYLPDKHQNLELFARNLLPNFTSWGNEVLQHQQIDFYEADSDR